MPNANPKNAVDGNVDSGSFLQPDLALSSSQNVEARMPVDATAEYYNMNHPKRGIALIFDHENFGVGNFNNRTGTAVDCKNLEEQLKRLDFDVRILKDSKYSDLIEVVDDESDHSYYDCFLMAILTHGGDSDILYAYDRQYKLDELWSKFTADRCPSLAGKPKLFIVQACRGDKVDSGIAMTRSRIQVDGETTRQLSYRIPIYADFLIAYSTVSGYYSFRDTVYGSWFIQALCDELKINGKTLDFQRILTHVARRVAIDYENNDSCFALNNAEPKQMPSVTSMLTRLILFSDKK